LGKDVYSWVAWEMWDNLARILDFDSMDLIVAGLGTIDENQSLANQKLNGRIFVHI
jgi:hypothetical protein